MNIHKLALILVLLVGLSTLASAQSFNIDLDVAIGNGQVGHGAPSAGFGAAAGQAGFWNAVDAGSPDATTLLGLDGGTTGAHIQASGGVGSAGGFNFAGNSGDYSLLLNDFADMGGSGSEVDYHFSGFRPGRYLIYTYAVNASGHFVNTTISVPGAQDQFRIVSGPMPGNQFIQGITHSVHDLMLTGSSFEIDVSGTWPLSECNGFQIVAVPEPCSLLTIGLGIGLVMRKVRRSRKRQFGRNNAI